MLTCLLTGILAALEVYAGQLVWPDFRHYPDVDTAYVFVSGKAGGPAMFAILNATLLVATIGSGVASMLGAARLLYGMGSENALPRMFAYVDPRTHVPARNVVVCGCVALAGALTFSYQLGVELLNFGAFLAFMGVNAASFVHYWVKRADRSWTQAAVPSDSRSVRIYGSACEPRRNLPARRGLPSVRYISSCAVPGSGHVRRTV